MSPTRTAATSTSRSRLPTGEGQAEDETDLPRPPRCSNRTHPGFAGESCGGSKRQPAPPVAGLTYVP